MTMALEELASRGHNWHDLLDGYSVMLVQSLCRAARENSRRDLVERTIGLSVGVSHAIELAFGGKGTALQTWVDRLLQPVPDDQAAEEAKNVMSDRARQFFQGLPLRQT